MIRRLWKFRKAAEEWRRERESALRAEIQIEESILHALRSELAELRSLEGEELVYRFLAESPAEVAQTMQPKRRFERQVEEILVESFLAGTWHRLFEAPRNFLAR